jgi:hypothetical protein
MKKLILITTITFISLSACKNSSEAMSTDNITPSSKETTTRHDAADKTYDVIISFISMASGIDQKIKAKVDTAIAEFCKKNKVTIKPEIIPWGREGERDYNFVLKNLSTTQKKAFIGSMEEAVGSSNMAHITFNQKSVHKR